MTPSLIETVKRRPKFGNVKTVVDGITFDSKKEARRWGELRLFERAGLIQDLQRQVKYVLDVNGQVICHYIADFTYREHGAEVAEDTKGFITPEFRIKAKLMKAVHGLEVRLT